MIILYSSLKGFNELVNVKIKVGVDINVTNGYKLCDFKPMYGFMFQDYIKDYVAWAHCDVDIILGDFIGFINGIEAGDCDIVSSHPDYLSGGLLLIGMKIV